MSKYLPLPFHVFLYYLFCNNVLPIHSQMYHLLHFHLKKRANSHFLKASLVIKVMHTKNKENTEDNT